MASETVKCSNCKRDVAASNYNLHIAHCEKRITLCKHCDEPVATKEMDQHMQEMHTRILCEKCRSGMERWQLEDHEKYCPKRIQECQYCDLACPFDELGKHEDQCGSRTEKCPNCQQYVLLKDADNHLEKLCIKRLVRCNMCKLQLPCDESREHSVWCVARKKIDMSEENESIGHAPLTNQFPESSSYGKKGIQEKQYFPRRIQECQYCDLACPFDELGKHEEQCGAQTEKCPNCHQYVLLRDADNHLEKLCIKRLVCCNMCNLQLPYDEFKEHCVRCVARKKIDMSEENESICHAPLTNQFSESDSSPYGIENQHCSSLELDESNKCSEEPAQNVSVDNEKFTSHGQNQGQPETSGSGEHESCPLCGALCLANELRDHITRCDAHIFICFYCKQNVPVTQTKNHSKTCSQMASLHFTKIKHKTQNSDDEIFESSSEEEAEGFHKCSNSVAANSLLPASQENGGSTKTCFTSVHSNQDTGNTFKSMMMMKPLESNLKTNKDDYKIPGRECVASASVTDDSSKCVMPCDGQKQRQPTRYSACTFCKEEIHFKNYIEHRKVCRERHLQRTQGTSDEHAWVQRELRYINGGSQTSEHAGLGNADNRCSERNGAKRKPDEEHNSSRRNQQNSGRELPTHFICAFCTEEISFKNYREHHSICRETRLQQTQETSDEHSREQRELRYINEGTQTSEHAGLGSEENRCSERNVAKRKPEQECGVTDPLAAVHLNPMRGTALPTAPLEDLQSSRQNSGTEADEICEFCGAYVMKTYFGEHVAMCGGSITTCPLCRVTMTNFDKKDHLCYEDAPPQNFKEGPRTTEHVVSSNEKNRRSKGNNTERSTQGMRNSSKQSPVGERRRITCDFCHESFMHSDFDEHVAFCGSRHVMCLRCKTSVSHFDLREHRCGASDATQSPQGARYTWEKEVKENVTNEKKLARSGYRLCSYCKENIPLYNWEVHTISCGFVSDNREKGRKKNDSWSVSSLMTAFGFNSKNSNPESYMQNSPVKNKGGAGRGNPYNYTAGRGNSNADAAGRGNSYAYTAGRGNSHAYSAGGGYNTHQARIHQTQDLDDQQKDVPIPCEFCGDVVPADEIILHESGCRRDLFIGSSSTEKNDPHAETVQAHPGRNYSEDVGDTRRSTSHHRSRENCIGICGGDDVDMGEITEKFQSIQSGCRRDLFIGSSGTEKNNPHAETVQAHPGWNYSEDVGGTRRSTSHHRSREKCIGICGGGGDVDMGEITEKFQNMQVTRTLENQNPSNPISDNERSPSGNEGLKFTFIGRINANEDESHDNQDRSSEVERMQQITKTHEEEEKGQVYDPHVPQGNLRNRSQSANCEYSQYAHTIGKGCNPRSDCDRKNIHERKVSSKGKSEHAEGRKNIHERKVSSKGKSEHAEGICSETGEIDECNIQKTIPAAPNNLGHSRGPNAGSGKSCDACRCPDQKESTYENQKNPVHMELGRGNLQEPKYNNQKGLICNRRTTPQNHIYVTDGLKYDQPKSVRGDAKACAKFTDPAWNKNYDAQPLDISKKTYLASEDKKYEESEIKPHVQCHNRRTRPLDTKNNVSSNRYDNSCQGQRGRK